MHYRGKTEWKCLQSLKTQIFPVNSFAPNIDFILFLQLCPNYRNVKSYPSTHIKKIEGPLKYKQLVHMTSCFRVYIKLRRAGQNVMPELLI